MNKFGKQAFSIDLIKEEFLKLNQCYFKQPLSELADKFINENIDGETFLAITQFLVRYNDENKPMIKLINKYDSSDENSKTSIIEVPIAEEALIDALQATIQHFFIEIKRHRG